MPGTAETGRFWLCPECRKHVPARKNACACGFDKTTVPVQMQEVSSSGRAAEPARERSFLGTVLPLAVIALLVAYIGYDKLGWGKAPPPTEPKAQAPTSAVPTPAQVIDLTPEQVAAILEEAEREGRAALQREPEGEPPDSEEPDSFFAAPVSADSEEPAPELPPLSEREQQERLADSIYRPRMMAVAEEVKRGNMLWRRYSDACLGKRTVTVRDGSRSGSGTTDMRSVSRGGSAAEVYDPYGQQVATVRSRSSSTSSGWASDRWSESWSETESLDHETTVECRLIASELRDVAPLAGQAVRAAEQEAIRRGVWTWLQVQTPDRLADELW